MKKIDAIIDSPSGKPIALDILLAQDRPKDLVVFCHGFKGFKDWGSFNTIQKSFAEAGISFLKFNFSHNGTTPESPMDFVDLEAFGQNNFSIELDDLDAVINWLRSQDYMQNLENINLIGHSRGGGLALLYASEKKLHRLITWAAVSDFGKKWDEDFLKKSKENNGVMVPNSRTKQNMPLFHQLFENYFENFDRLHIPSRLSAISCATLVVHGKNDAAVDYNSAMEISDGITQGSLMLLAGADHVFGAKHPWNDDTLPPDLQYVVNASIDFIKKA